MRIGIVKASGAFIGVATAGLLLVTMLGASPQPIPAASKTHCPDLVSTAADAGSVPTTAAGTAAPPTVQALRAPGAAISTPSTAPSVGAASGGRQEMPYPLPTRHGKTGREEPVDDLGRVPSTGMGVTWAAHAALGAAYRDYYVTMLWEYAAWDFNGHARDIDQSQFDWFAVRPRLVLVTNPRTHKSIIAAAIEAGPGPWVSFGGDRDGPAHGWNGYQRGVPAGFDGIVSGFPPTALAALDARTGYRGETGDDLIYQWAPDQNAIPGPTTLTASTGGNDTVVPAANQVGGTAGSTCAPPDGATGKGGGTTTGQVVFDGSTVTIPVHPNAVYQGRDYGGTTIAAPNAGVAKAIAAGMAYLGTPYVWGGGGPAGPDNGCRRASCLPLTGFDCSGLTAYMMAVGDYSIPGNSAAQRDRAKAIPWSQALPGDLIGYPGHISVYLGTIDGQRLQIEAPHTGDVVKISTVHRTDVDDVVYRWWGTARA
ncbi:C40 family peptidase [Nakamurella lactea]|uniref:C40 family peptidase n=1 Tax=Nakamurella lactea TaxID=459515 RepID=UPI000419D4DF|nr:NlpC/P60 family protein [Nakamurella lactea]